MNISMKTKLACLVLSMALSACGGGGGGSSPVAQTPDPTPTPVPVATNTVNVQGVATASSASFFKTTAKAMKVNTQATLFSVMTVVPDAWNCDSQYTTMWSALPKNVDINGDGTPDYNITDSAGVITFSIDVKGDHSIILNKGTAANLGTLVDKDQDCTGVATLNLDTNNDGVPVTNIDSNGDGIADYSIIDTSAVTVANAAVVLTNKDTGEVVNTTSGSDGKFLLTGIKTGAYHMEIRGHASDGMNIWNVSNNIVISNTSNDLGTFSLNRNPVLRSVTVDGVVSNPTNNYSMQIYPTKILAAGDTVNIQIAYEDPNTLPVVMTGYGDFLGLLDGNNAIPVSNYTLNYVVNANDVIKPKIQFSAELNNNDGITGMDAYRDMFVAVTYATAANVPPPAFNSVAVNGVTYTNPNPLTAFNITTPPVPQNAPVTIVVNYDNSAPNTHFSAQWIDVSTGTITQQESLTGEFIIAPSATQGVYAVAVTLAGSVGSGLGIVDTITIPIDTTEKPAVITDLLVNGLPYKTNPLKVGDTVTMKAVASDPNGLPIQYSFQMLGTSSVVSNAWQSSDTLTYTINKADVTSQFGIRVWIRNNDSRTKEGGTNGDDAMMSFYMVTTE